MVKDKSNALVKMTYLDEALKDVGSMEGRDAVEERNFSVDGSRSHLFEVLSGQCVIATTWREMPDSDEVTGLFSLNTGDACLVLPGEPYLVRLGTDSQVSEFVLESYVQ